MMTKLKFEITWEDVQHIAKQRNGYILNKKSAIALLSDIEDGVREWFVATKGDSICDALDRFIPTRPPDEPRDHNDAEGVVTMRDLA